MKKFTSTILPGAFALLAVFNSVSGAPVLRSSAGSTPAAIQSQINLFYSDLGGVDNGTGNSFTTGRRELDFGLIPDNFAEPNNFPGDFFKTTVPRGALLSASCAGLAQRVAVSADASNPTNTPLVFSNVEPSYLGQFITYNSQRVMGVRGPIANSQCSDINVTFSIPGTNVPATVKGFGIVFTDADSTGPGSFRVFDANGNQLGNIVTSSGFASGLSFVGVSFNAGERIASVNIISGSPILFAGNTDAINDVVAISAMFYGEPRASQFHSGDFDGDGSSDSAIFRPTSGQWFTINSGSNTVSIDQWGVNGDIPVDGDFDGDSRADFCIFRPSLGQWWFRRSSDGSTFAAQFGQPGDEPAVGDYDKDGKSDIALWRPSNGNYFVLRSSSNFSTFYGYPFGANGDIPVQGGAQ